MMTDYLGNVLSNFPDTIQVRVATPLVEQLLTVRYKTDRKILD